MEDIWSNLDDIATEELFRVGGTSVTATSVLVLLASIGLFVVVARMLARALQSLMLRRTNIGQGGAFAFARVVQYSVIALGLIISLQFVGLDLSSLALILGAVGIGIGFGLQSIIANFIAGILMLFERPIRVGDHIEVDGIEGDVTEINMRATTLRSGGNHLVFVPNFEFITSPVVNWSHSDKRGVVTVNVGVSRDSDIDMVINALLEVARDHPDVLREPPPEARLAGFGESAWDMNLSCWIAESKEHFRVRTDLNLAIVRRFRADGIEIPFAQRDINLRSPVPLPISGATGGEDTPPSP